MQELSSYEKRGYLHSPFRLFRLKDTSMERIDWHFHEFHKLILFLSGQASYYVEGKHYTLLPGDLLLVPCGCIHRPEIGDQLPYERIVVYLSPEYLRRQSAPDCPLELCFTRAQADYSFVLRPSGGFEPYLRLLDSLSEAMADQAFGAALLRRCLFSQLLIAVNRDSLRGALCYVEAADCDEKIVAILQYLNVNLEKPISIDALAQQFYLSKYHMMRRFRAETGFTIHSYLTEKRLQWASDELRAGLSAQETCTRCGFQDYSAFSRAYKKRYGVSPGAARRAQEAATATI